MTLKELKIYRRGYKKGLEDSKNKLLQTPPEIYIDRGNWNSSTYYCAYKGRWCSYCSSLGTCENTACPYDFNYTYTNWS